MRLQSVGERVAHFRDDLALVILGLSLGKLRVKGVSLGLAWILFIGNSSSVTSLSISVSITPTYSKEFGLILASVHSIGLEGGTRFLQADIHEWRQEPQPAQHHRGGVEVSSPPSPSSRSPGTSIPLL